MPNPGTPAYAETVAEDPHVGNVDSENSEVHRSMFSDEISPLGSIRVVCSSIEAHNAPMNITRKSFLRCPLGQPSALVLVIALGASVRLSGAEAGSFPRPRALPEGTFPDDERLKPLK